MQPDDRRRKAFTFFQRGSVYAKLIVIDPPAGLIDLNAPGRPGERGVR